MSKPMAGGASDILARQEGFALVTAIMLLFVAMILGLMVVDSSDVEVVLSGAQQRYEDSLNTVEGAAGVEATVVGLDATITRGGNSRSYPVARTDVDNQIISPTNPGVAIFDPGNDMAEPEEAYTVDIDTLPARWPMDNLLQSDSAADNRYDYHYRVVYLFEGAAPKGFKVNDYSGFQYQISAQRDTLVEMGAAKVGPKSE
jgi:hypothetical protein